MWVFSPDNALGLMKTKNEGDLVQLAGEKMSNEDLYMALKSASVQDILDMVSLIFLVNIRKYS